MESKISQVLNEVKDLVEMAGTDPSAQPINVRPGFAHRVAEAKRLLPEATEKLLSFTIPDRLTAVFADGDEAKAYEAAAILKDHDELVLDTSDIYVRLATAVEPAFSGDRVFNTSQFALLVAEYQNMAYDLGIERAEPPEYKEAVCFTSADTIKHVRKLIRSAIGDELLIKALRKQVADAVIEGNLDGPKIPVLVLGVTEEERHSVRGLFSKSTVRTFAKDEKITKEVVASLFRPAAPPAAAPAPAKKETAAPKSKPVAKPKAETKPVEPEPAPVPLAGTSAPLGVEPPSETQSSVTSEPSSTPPSESPSDPLPVSTLESKE